MSAPSRSLKDLFLAALEVALEDRVPWLERECAADTGLREHLGLMLAAHDAPQSLLDRPAPEPRADSMPTRGVGAVVDEPATERPGTVIGCYKLIEPIGEGGMGSVWMAQQQEPVKRLVAVKLIKAGMDTREVLARFEAERQALALMDHPHIAKVLDAGATGAGRPYFVMELVEGVPITAYCDAHRLTPRQRLGLFVGVCSAVQHAHQKGIIHRDLKPSNVLVALYDDQPVPKVIDFGVAKATGPKLTERTLCTEFGSIVGTLEYMSPEQAQLDNHDIDTRSDVYSLGVLLYELLTGTTLLEKRQIEETALLEILRQIREEEPPRPSARLSAAEELPTIAANRGLEAQVLRRLVRGELDWIVLKCLEKDRNRRYDTANALARDIERYLADEPVEACPPSRTYRLRKFAHKYRALLGTAAAFLILLAVGGAVTAWQAVRVARAEREEARLAARVEREEAQLAANRARQRAARVRRASLAYRQALQALAQAESEGPTDRYGKWAEAQAMARRAEAILGNRAAEPSLAAQIDDLLCHMAGKEKRHQLLARLEEIRLAEAEADGKGKWPLPGTPLTQYRSAFWDYGVLWLRADPQERGTRLRGLPPEVLGTLIAAIDHWLDLARLEKAKEVGWLEQLLAAADGDPWRQRLRAVRGTGDRAALEQLAREADVTAQPPQALLLLERALRGCGSGEAIALLRRAHRAHPDDFWINLNLGTALARGEPPQPDEGIRFLTAAVALRPQSAGAHLRLGVALEAGGRPEEALAAYRRAAELKPDSAEARDRRDALLRRAPAGSTDETDGR